MLVSEQVTERERVSVRMSKPWSRAESMLVSEQVTERERVTVRMSKPWTRAESMLVSKLVTERECKREDIEALGQG